MTHLNSHCFQSFVALHSSLKFEQVFHFSRHPMASLRANPLSSRPSPARAAGPAANTKNFYLAPQRAASTPQAKVSSGRLLP